MWIGTSAGLYLLDKFSGKYRSIDMPVESMHIHALYQGDDGVLYIGTSGSGLVLYNPEEEAFAQYYTDNSALISNNIYTILPNRTGIYCLVRKMELFIFHLVECHLITGHVNRGL